MIDASSMLRALLKNNFPAFLHKAFKTINPARAYIHNWHLKIIASYLEKVRQGQIKRLIINMPPRALKSVCVSVAFPAWLLAHNPAIRIIVASYCQTLSVKHSLDCRFVINSPWYRSLFKQTKLSRLHNQKSKFLTTENGFRFATSIGGSTTGEGGDVLIIDDPHNPTYIYSEKMRYKAIEWYEQTFASRLNDQNNGAIILVMQRLHEHDLTGHLLSKANNSWKLLTIPAIADQNYEFDSYVFKEGQALYSNLYEYFNNLSAEIGIENFSAQYLQKPINNNSSIIAFKDLKFYNESPVYNFTIQSWDTAIKVDKNSDYSVCTTWGVQDNRYFLLHVFRDKLTYSELKKEVLKLAERYKSQSILIEDKASGQSLIQDLKIETNLHVIAVRPKLDKITRFSSCTPYFYQGRVLLPENKYAYMLEELTTFPHSRNDDIIDSISQFLNYMKTYNSKMVRIRSV
jgi:predicted phage terminase large subunit-like protein